MTRLGQAWRGCRATQNCWRSIVKAKKSFQFQSALLSADEEAHWLNCVNATNVKLTMRFSQ